jgi:serine/threonine-protein kinase
MQLAYGTRLGPYEILAPLGAGGMGEVYRAHDPRMGREVAIKVSAERFSDRFEREVRAVAALNHPNICHIYDVGPDYLVMELVEGPTLAERIAEGAIPLEEALRIARQIGDALESAHEKGIIHRDLKPANIKLRPDGTAKVLDFGLAKMAERAAAAASPEESPTVAMRATMAGQIMGTAPYMSPEQARSKPVDKRADIWAFGVVLYEMLTGRRLFEGENVSDTLAAVLTEEPEWERVPATVQPLLRSCLEKDPNKRLRDIGDASRLLEYKPAVANSHTREWKLAAAGLSLLCAIAFLAPWRRAVVQVERPSMRLDLDLGPETSFGSTTGPAVILSPDGTRLVYVSTGSDGIHRLYTRRLDQPKAVQMPGTEGAYAQFFSPDGQWVGFFALGRLKKTRVEGGEPVLLCDAPAGRGASWGDDGNIVAALDLQTGLSLVPPEGGKPVPVTTLNVERGKTAHRWPHFLPGGKEVIFTNSMAYIHYYDANIDVVSLKDGRTKTLLEHAGMFPHYLPGGHLVYVNKGVLFGVVFDPSRLAIRGAPVRLWEVADNPNVGFGQFDFSREGVLAYQTGGAGGLRSVEWLNASGTTEPLGFDPAYYSLPRLSPDGALLAYFQGPAQEIWLRDLQRGSTTRVFSGQAGSPTWTRDGRFLVFQAAGGMFWTRVGGGSQPQPLTHSKAIQLPFSFSPDGKRLAYTETTQGAGSEIRTLAVEERGDQLHAADSQFFIKTPVGQACPAFSPDGRWLAYSTSEAGPYEVYVRAFPDNGARVQISNAGGLVPVWSRTGHELYYRTEDHRIMVANYTVRGGTFVPDKARIWSARRMANTGLSINFDLAPDGKRFLVLLSAESQDAHSQSHVTRMMNFFDEVRRRLAQPAK